MRIPAVLLATGLLAACGDPPVAQGQQAQAATTRIEVETIDPNGLAARIEAGDVRLVDVRTPEEFSEGHIDGAINVPVEEFDPMTLPEADGKETILYCRSGRRSLLAAEKLSRAKEAPATHLDGGIVAWEEAGQSVTPPK